LLNVAGNLTILATLDYGWFYCIAVHVFYFGASTYSKAHTTGTWSWTWFRDRTALYECYERYFQLKLIPEGHLLKGGKYVLGFHPHGVLPVTTFWATRGRQWREFYPGLAVDVLGASVMFWVPLM
jgi:hypothetical protein